MRPVIGITPSPQLDEFSHGDFYRFAMSDTYVRAVLAAGGLPVVLPPALGTASDLLDTLDGLLLSGGADVAPERYGDTEIHPDTYGVDPLRDAFELELIAEARQRDTPIFCICRGIQILNVALGGTLIQHVPEQRPSPTPHRQHEAGIPKDEIAHSIVPASGGLVAEIFGAAPLGVNSFHHQAIRDVAEGLTVEAISDDGLVEAVTLPSQTFVLGVQWHPEMMFERHPEQLAPFRALVSAATAHRLAPTGRRAI